MGFEEYLNKDKAIQEEVKKNIIQIYLVGKMHF